MKTVKNILPLKEFHTPGDPYVSLSERQKSLVKAFNDRVLSGKVEYIEVPCLCGGEEFALIAAYERHGMAQKTVLCLKCGLILSNPRMSDKEYERFYGEDVYRNLYEPFDFLTGYEDKYSPATGAHMYRTITKFKDPEKIKHVLEFGCGGGWNLIPFKEKGIEATGYDYSPGLVDLGRKHGLDLFRGGIEDIRGEYDVIILNHVTEHLTDLRGSFKRLKERITPGGIFYIAVPDIKNFSMGHLQNAHTYYFTIQTLRYYLEECGLSLLHHEPAQVIHLAAIFKNEEKSERTSLAGHPDEIMKVLKRYYIGESLYNIFNVIGAGKAMRRFANTELMQRFKSEIYKRIL